MKLGINGRWALTIAANVLFICVLAFYRSGDAAQPTRKEPFANAVEQRQEMIAELKEISAQLKEQNALLRSGKLKVVVVQESKK